jgi:hypothetical protein
VGEAGKERSQRRKLKEERKLQEGRTAVTPPPSEKKEGLERGRERGGRRKEGSEGTEGRKRKEEEKEERRKEGGKGGEEVSK